MSGWSLLDTLHSGWSLASYIVAMVEVDKVTGEARQ